MLYQVRDDKDKNEDRVAMTFFARSAQGPAKSYQGRFSDGRTATSPTVEIGFDDAALVINREEGTPPLLWRLKSLEVAELIGRSSIDVLINEPGRGGATLFVGDQAFIAELAKRAPHLTAGSRRWQGAAPFLWVLGVIVAIAGLVYITDFSPARSIAGLIPHDSRAALGREVVKSMTSGRRVCIQDEGKEALAKLAATLSAASGSNTLFDISVVDSDVINAFAAPGNQVVIMRKLLETAQSADEVAGVLAHEMGHGLELHPESGIVRAVGLTAITQFVLGGGGSLANVGLYLAQLGYSRQAERQADLQAIAILKSAGVPTKGIIDFFNRMARFSGEAKRDTSASSRDTFDILRTHPSTAERIALFQSQPAYPTSPVLTAVEWQALRSICGPTLPVVSSPPRPDASPQDRPGTQFPPSPPGTKKTSPRDI